jgi:hypothetical protein
MIVSRDEFLLLMQKWKNSSAQLRLLFISGGKTGRPLSSALIVKLSARISGIDADESFLACSVGPDGIISVGFEGASFDFGTPTDSTVAGINEVEEREIDEAVSVGLTCGIVVVFLSFR